MSRSDRVAKYNQLIRIEEAWAKKHRTTVVKRSKARHKSALSDLKMPAFGLAFFMVELPRPDAPPPPEEPPPPLNPPPLSRHRNRCCLNDNFYQMLFSEYT